VSAATKATRRRLPIFEGLLPIDTSRVPSELIAGATLGALAIPETMGYANMAGMPVITGLYTIVIPLFLFAIFGSSRHLVVGADSATAVVLAAGLVGMGQTAGSPTYVALAGLAALMVAVVLIAARLLRLGFIANFLSRAVLIGRAYALAICLLLPTTRIRNPCSSVTPDFDPGSDRAAFPCRQRIPAPSTTY